MSNFKTENWELEAIELMVRSGMSLKQAAIELSPTTSTEECNTILRRATFQRLLWEARHRYFSHLGANPNFKKETAIGKLLSLGEHLEQEGKFDAAAEVIFKICKMNGWVGPESTVNVFGDLSQKDIDTIREKVLKATEKRVN